MLTHKMLEGIIEHQRKYLKTGDSADLVPLSQVELTNRLNYGEGYDERNTAICNSWISRLINRISVIIPSGEETPLRCFFQTSKDVNKRLIKQILDKENQDLESGRLKKPYTDSEIRLLLEDRLRSRATKPLSRNVYRLRLCASSRLSSSVVRKTNTQAQDAGRNEQRNRSTDAENRNGHSAFAKAMANRRNHNRLQSISIWTVGKCRKEMGIPPARRRLSGYNYPPLSVNFSMLYPLTVESVQDNVSTSSGVYEIRLKGKELEYPNGKTNVIYLGSTTNLRKRLKEHLRANNKNGK